VLACSCFGFSQAAPHSFDLFLHFRPRVEMPGEQFVGREVCARCHAQKSRSHTAMEHALLKPEASTVLKSHPRMQFSFEKYSYEISYAEGKASFRVTDGENTIIEPVLYAFGNGYVAQTYVLQHHGKLYEGRVSYYSRIDRLDWTIGDVQSSAPTLEEAFGRDINSDEARNCFSCHGTGALVDKKLNLEHLMPGVSCEACHGPGATHVVAMRTGSGNGTYIFNPKNLDPDTLSQQFCGACHRSADTVGMMPDLGGINNVRFQPYRMASSRGHSTSDPHFACTACHDPHVDLNKDAAAYDTNCTSCHFVRGTAVGAANQSSKSAGKRSPASDLARACPVGKDRCVSCHMPKVELPGAHFQFTDHRIRIARPGEKYPV
jgi:Cytochrome c554 and c-prime